MVPYTTKSGVQIGIRYQPPKQGMSRDEELVQQALLNVQKQRTPRLSVIIVVACICYMLVGFLFK